VEIHTKITQGMEVPSVAQKIYSTQSSLSYEEGFTHYEMNHYIESKQDYSNSILYYIGRKKDNLKLKLCHWIHCNKRKQIGTSFLLFSRN